MNLSHCLSRVSTHSAGKPVSTALFCDCVQRDCSFRAYYSFGNEQGLDVYIQDILWWYFFVCLSGMQISCMCAREIGGKSKYGVNDDVSV